MVSASRFLRKIEELFSTSDPDEHEEISNSRE